MLPPSLIGNTAALPLWVAFIFINKRQNMTSFSSSLPFSPSFPLSLPFSLLPLSLFYPFISPSFSFCEMGSCSIAHDRTFSVTHTVLEFAILLPLPLTAVIPGMCHHAQLYSFLYSSQFGLCEYNLDLSSKQYGRRTNGFPKPVPCWRVQRCIQ